MFLLPVYHATHLIVARGMRLSLMNQTFDRYRVTVAPRLLYLYMTQHIEGENSKLIDRPLFIANLT